VVLDKEPARIEVTSPNGGVAQWERRVPRLMAAALAVAPALPPVPPRPTIRNRRHVGTMR
jgi:hypothetical protein